MLNKRFRVKLTAAMEVIVWAEDNNEAIKLAADPGHWCALEDDEISKVIEVISATEEPEDLDDDDEE